MKKLLFVNDNLKIGGVQKSLCNLLWELRGRYDVTLLLFSPQGAYLKQLPPEVKVITAGKPWAFLGTSQGQYAKTSVSYWHRGFWAAVTKLFGRHFTLKLMGLFQRPAKGTYDAAVSFLHNEAPGGFYGGTNEFVLRKVRADRKVAFLHCDYETCGANDPGNNRIYGQFDAIAACSQGCRDVFLHALPQLAHKCQVVYNCTRFEEIQRLSRQAPVIYEENHLTVVTVARLTPAKGLHRALNAVAHAIAQGIPVKYHLIGDGKARAFLEARAKELGLEEQVVFHGEQENPYRYMANADLFLLASYHEAAPMVIWEALSLGVPVLSVKTTSSEEMLLHTGGGWVCENEGTALKRALFAILQNPEKLAEKKTYLQTLSMDNRAAVEEFIRLIEDINEHD